MYTTYFLRILSLIGAILAARYFSLAAILKNGRHFDSARMTSFHLDQKLSTHHKLQFHTKYDTVIMRLD